MKAVKTYRDDWVVQFPNGVSRPGVFEDEAAALASMYLTTDKLRGLYVPMRDGGAPLTVDQINCAAALTR
ncbi:MAG: hypothetical protein GXP16_09080 [Gammaproteobacteria bacterium]|nr:hypothetical protein [Gammaproteobacteria bacterium]